MLHASYPVPKRSNASFVVTSIGRDGAEWDILAEVDQKNVWQNHTDVDFHGVMPFGVLPKIVGNIIAMFDEVELVYIVVPF